MSRFAKIKRYYLRRHSGSPIIRPENTAFVNSFWRSNIRRPRQPSCDGDLQNAASTRGSPDANVSGSIVGAGGIPDQALRVSKHKGGLMKHRTLVFVSTCIAAFSAAWTVPAHAWEAALYPSHSPPFTSTLSNTAPLVFGMDAVAAADALGVPLNYISGRPGNEVFLAFRNYSGSDFFNRKDRLYLQFREGRLTGWKGDWGRNWMWR